MSENSNTGPIIPADFLIDGQIDVQFGTFYESGSSTLAGLNDVDLTTPSDGQALIYDATSDKWINGEVSVVADLDDLNDVSITTPSSGQILKYNGTTWINDTAPAPTSELDDLSDVDLTTPSDGQALIYDATNEKWINGDAGVSDYRYLDEKPEINGITLIGNKTAEDLNLTWVGTQAQYDAIVSKNPAVLYFITDGAQNSKAWTDIIGTLTAGSTEITFTNTAITSNSTVDVYTHSGVEYNSISVTTGAVVLTFDEQESDLDVKVRIS